MVDHSDSLHLETTLVYHPDNPGVILVASGDCEKYKLYREGYKKVSVKKIGNKLRRLRESVNMTQDQMATYLGLGGADIPPATYRRIEAGTVSYDTLNATKIRLIAKALALPPESLYSPGTRKRGSINKQRLQLVLRGTVAFMYYVTAVSPVNVHDPLTLVLLAHSEQEVRRLVKELDEKLEIQTINGYDPSIGVILVVPSNAVL